MSVDVQQMRADLQQNMVDITHLRQRSDELPIVLANSQAGPHGLLFNPTAIMHGWAPLLTVPNLRTWDELLHFTSEFDLPFLNSQ